MIQTIPSNDFGGSLQWTGSLWGPDHLVLGTDARTIIAQTTDDLFSSSGSTGQTLARGQQLGWGLFGEWILPATEGLTVIPSVRADWVEVTIMARYLSRQFTDDLNTQSVADFVVLDASLQRQLRKGLRLVLNGENLTDRHYIATQTGPVKTLGSPLLIMGGIRAEY
ncbi:MAG TPA: hypothetical protein VF819_01385 [Nitrospira sp.]